MTEEEIQALQVAKEAAETRAAEVEAAAQAAKAEADKAKADLSNVVNELTDVRKKKAEAEEKLNKINNPNPGTGDPQDVSSIVQAELARREQERIRQEMDSAIEEFKNSKTEFQSDSAGLVFDKFKSELSRFNFADVTNKEQAKARLEEAYRFLRQKSEGTGEPDYEGTASSTAIPPQGDTRTPADVAKTLEQTGMTQEQYNKLASKYGDALTSLGLGR